MGPFPLNRRWEQALAFCLRAHQHQVRKGAPEVPYATHCIQVALLVQSLGFGENVMCAALLHDTLEDTPTTADDLDQQFGSEVRMLVEAVTENKAHRWEQRKEHTVAMIPAASREVQAIILADKTHNLRDVLLAHEVHGADLWRVFSRGPFQTLNYYRKIRDALRPFWHGNPVFEKFDSLVQQGEAVLL